MRDHLNIGKKLKRFFHNLELVRHQGTDAAKFKQCVWSKTRVKEQVKDSFKFIFLFRHYSLTVYTLGHSTSFHRM